MYRKKKGSQDYDLDAAKINRRIYKKPKYKWENQRRYRKTLGRECKTNCKHSNFSLSVLF